MHAIFLPYKPKKSQSSYSLNLVRVDPPMVFPYAALEKEGIVLPNVLIHLIYKVENSLALLSLFWYIICNL